jgi:hypothetical protein
MNNLFELYECNLYVLLFIEIIKFYIIINECLFLFRFQKLFG